MANYRIRTDSSRVRWALANPQPCRHCGEQVWVTTAWDYLLARRCSVTVDLDQAHDGWIVLTAKSDTHGIDRDGLNRRPRWRLHRCQFEAYDAQLHQRTSGANDVRSES